MLVVLQIPTGSGIVETIGKVAATVASVVLILMIVALAGYAYKHLQGDGIEWPDDVEDPGAGDDEVESGDDDDEWDYY